MLKLICCGAIILTAAMMGNYFAAAMEKRLELLKTLGIMFAEAENLIRYSSADVYELTDALGKKFCSLDFLQNDFRSERPFSEIWSCRISQSRLPFSKNDRLVMQRFGDGLGKTDLEGQLGLIGLTKSEVNSSIAAAEEDCRRKCRLYRTLGILGGVLILLMII